MSLARGVTNVDCRLTNLARHVTRLALGVVNIARGVTKLARGVASRAIGDANLARGVTNLARGDVICEGCRTYASAGNTTIAIIEAAMAIFADFVLWGNIEASLIGIGGRLSSAAEWCWTKRRLRTAALQKAGIMNRAVGPNNLHHQKNHHNLTFPD